MQNVPDHLQVPIDLDSITAPKDVVEWLTSLSTQGNETAILCERLFCNAVRLEVSNRNLRNAGRNEDIDRDVATACVMEMLCAIETLIGVPMATLTEYLIKSVVTFYLAAAVKGIAELAPASHTIN